MSASLAFASLLLASTPLAAAQGCDPELTARYELRFDATWSQATHPVDWPSSAHWSGLIGGTHDSSIEFWADGALASPGIESMAETGSKSLLTAEVNAAINAGQAGEVISGPGIGVSPGSATVQFDVTSDHPLATAVSMIAPSPDWFVGVNGVDLRPNGKWADSVVVTLAPWDAGTDSGTMYTSGNQNTNPQDPIAEITGYPFFGVPLGTFTFTKISGEDLGLCVEGLVAGQSATVTVTGGTPGELTAVMWSLSLGSVQSTGANWCVDFGIDLPIGNPTAQLGALGAIDAGGVFTTTRNVPANLSGTPLYFQAAERNTCPDSRMSNIVAKTVQ